MINFKSDREFDALGIGEVMLRLSPSGKERISYSETFEKMAGGSELNVVSGISMLGLRTGMITKLPRSEIGKFIKHKIRFAGTSDDYILYDNTDEKRLGIYYYESGAYPRVPIVSYDRKLSSFCSFKEEEVPEDIYKSAKVFHTSGITLALSHEIRREVTKMVKKFHDAGASISFDVNYRASLWSEEAARSSIEKLLPMIDILFISEETLRRMFGMTGTLEQIHRRFASEHPNLSIIASTSRTVISPTKHSFSSLVYDCREDRHYSEPAYENIDVVDRIGSGDAYVAGALYGLLKHGNIEQAVSYGNAMAALKNTIMGDMVVSDLSEVDRIIRAHNTTGPKSEMIR